MGLPRLCFIHMMKTGGWSLSAKLGNRYDPARRYPQQGLPPVEMRRQKTDVDLLLGLDRRVLDEIDFFSLHMPAWVAKVVAPDHRTLTIVREPVQRTLSHLRQLARMAKVTGSLEALYDHPDVRHRITNFQVRMLGMLDARHDEPPAPSATDQQVYRAALRDAPDDLPLIAVLATRVQSTDPAPRDDLDRARHTVDQMDLVLTTDTLAHAADAIQERLGIAIPRVPYLNETDAAAPAEERLERRIREDSQLDLELYEHARALVG